MRYQPSADLKPFLIGITPIENPTQPCKAHYDIWYAIPTDGHDFKIDPREFHETRWLTVDEARILVADPLNLQALAKIEEILPEAP